VLAVHAVWDEDRVVVQRSLVVEEGLRCGDEEVGLPRQPTFGGEDRLAVIARELAEGVDAVVDDALLVELAAEVIDIRRE